jgi:long-subunit acyl-CoA synthetase (AMP-forming)
VESLELATVAKQAYVLAQAFNSFYHRYPVAQEDDPAVLMYTGGTTGLPKGVLLDQRAEMLNTYHIGMVLGFAGAAAMTAPSTRQPLISVFIRPLP